jgi:hypothetical protein
VKSGAGGVERAEWRRLECSRERGSERGGENKCDGDAH